MLILTLDKRKNYIFHILLVGENIDTVEKFYKLEVEAGFVAGGYDKTTMNETSAPTKKDSEAINPSQVKEEGVSGTSTSSTITIST